MPVVTLNPNVKPSGTQYSYISLIPAVSSPPPPRLFLIEGLLPNGGWLMPTWVKVVEEDIEEGEEKEFVVIETKYYMHGAGETISEAADAFKRIVSQYLDGLTKRENHLSPQMREQLEYLRSVIRISQ
jgi:hypothetical protein